MSIIRRLDIWLGKTLFHPPIILICQRTRQTQYAVHRALWFFSACVATATMSRESWGAVAMMWAWTLFNLVNASWQPDRPTYPFGLFRFIIWVLLVPDILLAATGHQPAWRGVAINTLVLFAEYAATIKTIPPRKTREKRAVGKGAFSGQ
jgi:hypothetical protein